LGLRNESRDDKKTKSKEKALEKSISEVKSFHFAPVTPDFNYLININLPHCSAMLGYSLFVVI